MGITGMGMIGMNMQGPTGFNNENSMNADATVRSTTTMQPATETDQELNAGKMIQRIEDITGKLHLIEYPSGQGTEQLVIQLNLPETYYWVVCPLRELEPYAEFQIFDPATGIVKDDFVVQLAGWDFDDVQDKSDI